MFISKIVINNFRSFKEITLEFNDGINAIIGHNNVGKSNLLRAMNLVLDYKSQKSLSVQDFNKSLTLEELKDQPPHIQIAVTFKQSKDEDLMSDDLVTVSDWLVQLSEPYEAVLTYQFFLPSNKKADYIKALEDTTQIQEAWKIIEQDFIRLYTYKIFGGEVNNQTTASSEELKKIDLQFLDAIRDVERDLHSGKNALLKNVISFFMDYEIKSDTSINNNEREAAIKTKKLSFEQKTKEILEMLQTRMTRGKDEILEYANDVGASFDNGRPNFDGNLSDVDMYAALKLVIEHSTGFNIPVSHNGLGYNNLIFMALLLAKMQVDSNSDYLGSNAKVFPVLCIEEPEAHLHPTMQLQFLKFLRSNLTKKKVRQVFITTHSTYITSSMQLDDLICLYKYNGEVQVAYPGKVFPGDGKSKNYVQRFLDATKANILFAERIILVEGIAEQVLLPVFAEYMDLPLEENHVTVINVGGRYFEHFLWMFKNNMSGTINRKVACITDRDPERKKISDEKYKKCYPFEYEQNTEYTYRYNPTIDHSQWGENSNIKLFTQEIKNGKTFEYELAIENPTSSLLLTDSLSNCAEIDELMNAYNENKRLENMLEILSNTDANNRIRSSIQTINQSLDEDSKKKSIIAARYLNSVGKGENALELSMNLKQNLCTQGTPEYQAFNIPSYIKDAVEWVIADDN